MHDRANGLTKVRISVSAAREVIAVSHGWQLMTTALIAWPRDCIVVPLRLAQSGIETTSFVPVHHVATS